MPGVYVEHFTTWCGGHGDYDRKHGGLHGTGCVSLLRIIVLRASNCQWQLEGRPLLHSMSIGHHLPTSPIITPAPGQDKQPRADLPGRERLRGVIPSGPTATGVSITRGFSLLAGRTANLFGFSAHSLCHLERDLVQHSISQMTIRHRAAAITHTIVNGLSLGNRDSDVVKEEEEAKRGPDDDITLITAYDH
ncbi:uncharacterized protein PgNI_12587 [Pyricularia grisea]|uniref:Uncharacterized protein n=1 Tax=Pyricularia grisea TaxID=148305 RepID=A0A6P8AM03_PYRGI|nr:uncharacterized protein PgNI_12587 [Pyricularia grisea]TLD03083.1 hypothetical protein PgNI_12587 [Pyricularia grisea]